MGHTWCLWAHFHVNKQTIDHNKPLFVSPSTGNKKFSKISVIFRRLLGQRTRVISNNDADALQDPANLYCIPLRQPEDEQASYSVHIKNVTILSNVSITSQ